MQAHLHLLLLSYSIRHSLMAVLVLMLELVVLVGILIIKSLFAA